MLHAKQSFIPILTSEAGLSLTTENWQEVNITTVCYYLESLLFKPGKDILQKITDLREYLAWSGGIVLNAMTLVINKEGIVVLKSPYDGSRIKLNLLDLLELILHLKPQAVVLPKNILQDFSQIWENWNEAIVPFIHVSDLERQNVVKPHGVYFNQNFSEVNWKQLEEWAHLPRYIIGNFDPILIQELQEKGIEFIESDEPAKAAMQGKVYSRAGNVDLTDKKTQMQFEPIDTHCACPTCSQQLSKAYLYHLLQNTPLLCQRFLIQHNIFYVQRFFEYLIDN
ncbi:MAG: tRNA-guanine transglycosylase [Legionella longbeachae]|nr:tRNA-guanine transglycosylase [Legionella longbeachae]